MGRPIVYCGICGKSLREEDFSKGKAHIVDNASFCIGCRIVPEPLPRAAPPAPKPPPAPPPLGPKPSGAASKPLPSATPRRAHAPVAEGPASMGLVIGIAVVVLAILVVVAILLLSGGPKPAPPAVPSGSGPLNRAPDAVHPPPSRPSGPEDDAQASAIRTLEAFAASSTDPQAVLDRCEEEKAKLRGTPYLPRLEAVEARAIEARAARNRDRQLVMSLENVQKLRDFDTTFERREEIENMIKASLAIAGSRKAEVEKLQSEYRKAADAYAARPRDPAPAAASAPSPAARLGPYDLDEGGMVRHWLVLGPFGNRNDRSGFQDHDLLKTESAHVPALGLEAGPWEGTKLRWGQAGPAGDRVVFRSIESLGLGSKPAVPAIVFAACWLMVEKECQVKLGMLVDDGYLLWLDHKRILKQSGQGWGSPEERLPVTLTAGPHLLLLKVGSVGSAEFGFRLRIVGPAGDPASGIRVWNQVPVTPRVLFSENFNQGRGAFVGGEVVPGGADGTTALAIPTKGASVSGKLPQRCGPTWTLRFKVKPSVEMKGLELIVWAGRPKSNFRYHLRGLAKDQWTSFELKAGQLYLEWNGTGPTLEGEVAHVVKFYFDDQVPDGSVLLDDFEVTE